MNTEGLLYWSVQESGRCMADIEIPDSFPGAGDVAGKRVVVTGAGRGLGRLLAHAFSGAGARVALVARTERDLKAVAAAGCHGCMAVTAVTVQSAGRVHSWTPVEPSCITAQIEACLEDGAPGAVKSGMLGTTGALDALASALAGGLAGVPYVLDPVLTAGSGDSPHGEGLSGGMIEKGYAGSANRRVSSWARQCSGGGTPSKAAEAGITRSGASETSQRTPLARSRGRADAASGAR